MRMVRRCGAFLLLIGMAAGCTVRTSYGAGWESKWCYIQENGQPLKGWHQLDKEGGKSWYFFDENGLMEQGWQLINERWYYFYDTGEMADGVVQAGSETLYFQNGALVDSANDERNRSSRYAREGRTEAEIRAAEERISEAVSYCNQGITPYEKAYRICEWMTEKLHYDRNGPYDVVGVLNTGGTICEGYAMVYRELAERLGFYCERVDSKEMNHAWNYIVVDGVGYYTDVTWDDAGAASYNMLTKEEIQKTHQSDDPQHR